MKRDDLRRIGDFEALCRYLEEKLGWPLGEYDFDALTFQYEPEELGLQDAYADAIESIHQLRPVTDGQPWGIFFVHFRKKKLPVGVLRRILSQLALKKRTSANKAERAAWLVDDLLFVSAFGDEAGKNREIAFAHFHQHGGDLPTLRVIGWDGNDTPLKLDYLQGVLANKLHWPSDPNDAEAWRALWRSPFRHRPGHVIRKSDELAHELAKLARAIRDRAQAVMKAESTRGPLTKLYDAFKKALIHDLTPEGFADTYAQTITYGLLTAAISRTEMSGGRQGTALLASDLADMVPVTNPFLKEMLQTFLEAGGRKGGIDFDELGVQDVVELLRGKDTDLPAILRDFGNKTRGEDPVIHFYEHFLKAYNKQLKVQRGVFYTPQPVVSYIVRSVHELLQSEFGLADGLADTTTWSEMLKQHPDLKLPLLTDAPGETRTISSDEPFVQILDPATGTATFLVEVIEVIHRTLAGKWNAQRLTDAQQRAAWNEYVPKHLLPRLHAYELMMAPYAISHMKIGLKLAETGYRFGTEERARIYLTNALEPWVKQLPLIGFDALAHEAAAVNEIKRHKRFLVIIGNPPYSIRSGNLTNEARRLVEPFKFINGQRIVEKGALQLEKNLNDDYVKFFGLVHELLANQSVGIVGLITNHAFLDNPTFRGFRWSLLSKFSRVQLLDLHGNSKKKEQVPAGYANENVFDIQQGVGVSILLRHKKDGALGDVLLAEQWGNREEKYRALEAGRFDYRVIECPAPWFKLSVQDARRAAEFSSYVSLTEAMPLTSTGIKTHRDAFVIDFDDEPLRERVAKFRSGVTDAAIANEFGLADTYGWKLGEARRRIRARSDWQDAFQLCLYRPLDQRHIYYHADLVELPRSDCMQHLAGGRNLALLTTRQVTSPPFNHVTATRLVSEMKTCSHDRGTNCFPLYLRDDGSALRFGAERRLNFSAGFLRALSRALGISDSQPNGVPSGLTPEDIFHFAYAVFHSPGYRSRYAEFLKTEFPRVPLTGNVELFRELARLGGELTALHLLESPRLDQPIADLIGGRSPHVEKISWSDNTVWVDKTQATGFHGVPEDVWNFHIGGYQVCEKWLKDRKGRVLSSNDIAHYHKIVAALSETIRLMADIDRVIDQHGGWPGAFAVSTEVVKAVSDTEPPANASRSSAGRAPSKEHVPDDLFTDAAPPQAPVKESVEGGRARIDLDDADNLCALLRLHLGDSHGVSRDDAIAMVARALGYQRTGSSIHEALDNAIRTAVRRGILQNDSRGISLRYRTLEDHAESDRNGLKTQFLASLHGRTWIERNDAVTAFARWMGFRRTGSRIEGVADSLISGLLREGRLEKDCARIRRAD